MFKKIKRLYKLAQKDSKIIDSLTDEQIASIPNEPDGKAVFFSEGTDEDYEKFLKEQDGTDKWYNRIKNL